MGCRPLTPVRPASGVRKKQNIPNRYHARRSGTPDHAALRLLYEALVQLAPTLGARVAHAVALSKTEGPASALARLDAIDRAAAEDYQPYWSARAYLLEQLGRLDGAREAYECAVGLAEDEEVRRWLLAKKRALDAEIR